METEIRNLLIFCGGSPFQYTLAKVGEDVKKVFNSFEETLEYARKSVTEECPLTIYDNLGRVLLKTTVPPWNCGNGGAGCGVWQVAASDRVRAFRDLTRLWIGSRRKPEAAGRGRQRCLHGFARGRRFLSRPAVKPTRRQTRVQSCDPSSNCCEIEPVFTPLQ